MFTLYYLFQAVDVVVKETDFNPEFVARMIPKLEWPALCQAAESVSVIERTYFCNYFDLYIILYDDLNILNEYSGSVQSDVTISYAFNVSQTNIFHSLYK